MAIPVLSFPAPSRAMDPLGSRDPAIAFPLFGIPLYVHVLRRFARIGGRRVSVGDLRLDTSETFARALADLGLERSAAPPAIASAGTRLYISSEHVIDLVHPWDILLALEALAAAELSSQRQGQIEVGVEISGIVHVDEGAIICSGARLKGNIYVGRHSYIGNNALVRGNVSLGERSVVGFGAEVKNAALASGAGIGQVAFVADSVIDSGVLFGGTARTSNYRFDGAAVDVVVGGKRISTGRQRMGAIVGCNARIGVGVVVLPGRKIGSGAWVGPNVVVEHNVADNARIRLRQQTVVEAQAPAGRLTPANLRDRGFR